MTFFLAELIGTFVLFFLGTSALFAVRLQGAQQKMGGRLIVALGWGLGWGIATYMVSSVGLSHINPAVTFGYAVIGKTPWTEVPFYLGGQVVGSFLGALVAYLLFLPKWRILPPKTDRLPLFATQPEEGKGGNHLMAQFIPTALFLMGLLAVRDRGGSELNPFLIGIVVLVLYTACSSAPGFSLNPARDIGSRASYCLLFPKKKGRWRSALLPILAPIAGGISGALLYQGFLG